MTSSAGRLHEAAINSKTKPVTNNLRKVFMSQF
jgi:hypothetical protein